jgi:hypothetical protein
MASLANLSREERIGLIIAALAHVALVAALVWQVRDERHVRHRGDDEADPLLARQVRQ